MSTNSECLIVEITQGSWYYVLETDRWDDDDHGDWKDRATAYGPLFFR